jgi:hypothetical protein
VGGLHAAAGGDDASAGSRRAVGHRNTGRHNGCGTSSSDCARRWPLRAAPGVPDGNTGSRFPILCGRWGWLDVGPFGVSGNECGRGRRQWQGAYGQSRMLELCRKTAGLVACNSGLPDFLRISDEPDRMTSKRCESNIGSVIDFTPCPRERHRLGRRRRLTG